MYSTKNIENILISALQNNRANKRHILADTLFENTRSQYQYFEDIEAIKEVLARPEYSQAVEAYKNGHRIYRGQKRQEEHLAAIVTPGTRRSKDGSNLYTRLLSDILPSWSEYPKRNKSAICTSSERMARGYSDKYVFVIFPINDTKIGECSKGDIWYSFPFVVSETYCDLDVFTFMIVKFISFVLNKSYYDTDEIFLSGTNHRILSLFSLVEAICQNKLNDTKFMEILKTNNRDDYPETYLKLFHVAQKGKLLDYIEYLMNPKANKFRLITVNQINFMESHELWFEGQHLMIRVDVAKQILNTNI